MRQPGLRPRITLRPGPSTRSYVTWKSKGLDKSAPRLDREESLCLSASARAPEPGSPGRGIGKICSAKLGSLSDHLLRIQLGAL